MDLSNGDKQIASEHTVSSFFIHATIHDGSHKLVLIGGIQNALQHAL